MKRFLRDLTLILFGASIAFIGKEAFASNQLAPISITCSAAAIGGFFTNRERQ